MLQAVGHILPIAVAVALSSVPITVIILILLSPNRNRSAIPFLIGWLIGLAGVAAAFVVFANLIPKSTVRKADLGIAIVLMVVGIALIVFSIVSVEEGTGAASHRLAATVAARSESIGPFSAFGLAIGLNLRPKALLPQRRSRGFDHRRQSERRLRVNRHPHLHPRRLCDGLDPRDSTWLADTDGTAFDSGPQLVGAKQSHGIDRDHAGDRCCHLQQRVDPALSTGERAESPSGSDASNERR